MADYPVNTVPLGEAGTGAAFILPASQSINQISNYIDSQQQSQAQATALKQQQAQQLAQAWQKNQLNIKAGTIFQPEINTQTQKVMDMGLDLQKRGINPNSFSNNPAIQAQVDQYNTERQKAIQMGQVRDDIAKQAQENEKLIQGQPSGYFDPQKVSAYHDFISGKTPLSTIMANGLQMPELSRTYDLQSAIDKLPAVPIKTTGVDPRTNMKTEMVLPNEEAHQAIATNFVNNTPEVQALIADKAGIPFNQIGNQTDPNIIKKDLDATYRSLPNIPSLASQGIKTFSNNNVNSNDVPDQGNVNPQYDALLNSQAQKFANAAKIKQSYIDLVKQNKDAQVHREDNKTWDYAYANHNLELGRYGMAQSDHAMTVDRYTQWKKDQQNEGGEFSVGNAGTYVPVVKSVPNEDGSPMQSRTDLEPGASLFQTKLPSVDVTLQPSTITNISTGEGGRTIKNSSPIQMKVGGMKMVPVWTGTKDNMEGSEMSYQQLKDVASGNYAGKSIANISFKPMVYGLQQKKDATGHMISTPISIPYDNFTGGSTKKVNTEQFDGAIDQLKAIQANPNFQALTPQQKLDFITKKYNIQGQ